MRLCAVPVRPASGCHGSSNRGPGDNSHRSSGESNDQNLWITGKEYLPG
jgi:hypothetical protein